MLSEKLLNELQEYVDSHLVTLSLIVQECMTSPKAFSCDRMEQGDMVNFVKSKRKPSFNQILFKYIDKMGVSDSDVYKKAGIDRRHFSKIRSNPDYHPSKNTAIALSLALELDQKEVGKLIGAAGYTLSESETFDLVIAFCLERKIYDIHDVNLALDYFSLKPLVGVVE